MDEHILNFNKGSCTNHIVVEGRETYVKLGLVSGCSKTQNLGIPRNFPKKDPLPPLWLRPNLMYGIG